MFLAKIDKYFYFANIFSFFMSQIGKNIKKIRGVKALSQQAFADLFDLTRGNISSYEEFRAEPKIEVLVRIANYFGIPLSDFIQKELSVNELLHFNAELVVETEKLKIAQQLSKVPYIPRLYLNDYVARYKDEKYLAELPVLTLPLQSRSKLLAIEVDNPENLPAGTTYHNGDVLVFEQVSRENAHRVPEKLGIMIDPEGIHYGVYQQKEGTVVLALNEWVTYPFDMDSENQYWLLRAVFTQGI